MGTILYGRIRVIEAITQSYLVDSREIATIHPGHEKNFRRHRKYEKTNGTNSTISVLVCLYLCWSCSIKDLRACKTTFNGQIHLNPRLCSSVWQVYQHHRESRDSPLISRISDRFCRRLPTWRAPTPSSSSPLENVEPRTCFVVNAIEPLRNGYSIRVIHGV